MASITATPLSALGIVKILIDWTPLQLSSTVHVYRVTPDGAEQEVIGSPVVLSGGEALVYDTSAPFDVELSYRAEIEEPVVSRDSFTRVVANQWGGDDLGAPYFPHAGALSDFSVNGSQGRISMSTTSAFRTILLGPVLTDVRMEATVSVSQVSAGAGAGAYLVFRYTSADNWYHFNINFNPGGELWLTIRRRDSTSMTTTTLSTVTLPFTYVAGTPIRIVGEAVGTTLRAKAWTTEEPDDWQIIYHDSTHASGTVGYRGFLDSGYSAALPTVISFDDTRVDSLVAQSIETGLATVELEAGRDGWIRDPQQPARSVRLDNCSTHTFSCLDAERFVFFQGLEEEEYESATGVFGVINSPHPLTVAQTRKGISSALRIVSTTLADIPALRSLFSPGRDLVLSLPTDYGWGIESYGTSPVTFHSVTASRLNPRDMRKPQRRWSLPLRVVDPDLTYPAEAVGTNDIPAPGATYADMEALGVTYGTLEGTPITDNFARGVSPGSWGIASDGPAWSIITGPAAQNSVVDSVGRMAQTDRSGPDFGTNTVIELPIVHTDIDMRARFRWNVAPAGDFLRASLLVRETDRNNWLQMELNFSNVDGLGRMIRRTRIAGVGTASLAALVPGLTYSTSSWYWIRVQVIGNAYSAWAWAMDDPEPTTPIITDTTTLASGNWAGVQGFTSIFSSNPAPEILDWDDVQITFPGAAGGRTYLDWSQGAFL